MSIRERARGPLRTAGLFGWTAAMLAAVESHKAVDRKLQARKGSPDPGAVELRQDQIFDRYMRTWTRVMLDVLRVDLTILGELPPPARGPRLVVSNHRSAVDIPILITHFGGSVLSRGDIESWPILGLAAQKAQTIFVDRESTRSGAQAIRAIRAQLAAGRTVSIFPEGTTFAGDELRPFNAGAFAACRKLEVEYVPIGLAYPPGCEYIQDNFLSHAQAIASRPLTPVVLAVGRARRIEAKAKVVADELHAEIETLIARARAELDTRR